MLTGEKPEKAVEVLLARLHKAKEQHPQHGKIERLLKGLTHVFPKLRNWEQIIKEGLRASAQELDKEMLEKTQMESPDVHGKKREPINLEDVIAKLESLNSEGDTSRPVTEASELTEDDHPREVSKEWVDLGTENQIIKSEAILSLAASLNPVMGSQVLKMCLLCLLIFPVNSIIKKKPLIYWWMGEGIVMETRDNTAEEVGEQVFQEILKGGFISPSSENTSPSVNSFIVEPWSRRMLIMLAEKNEFLRLTSQRVLSTGKWRAFLLRQGNESYSSTNNNNGKIKEEIVSTVFNVDKQYLGMGPEWLANLKKVEVLQMGRWQNSVRHHIEVEHERLLIDGLGSQKRLKYLSLQGISRIEMLPSSISKLISLQILDLRACHNLEKLPSSISELKNLTHLDMSECYLLESMPKGLVQLPNLQVLKGFVIGNARKSTCKISDLAGLEKLRKLSIRVCKQSDAGQDYQLESFPALRILKISWRAKSSVAVWFLPSDLMKLDLECMPFKKVPGWLSPSKLPKLEKLYVNGGELESLKLEHREDSHKWKLKFLRLKNLSKLESDQRRWSNCFQNVHLLT